MATLIQPRELLMDDVTWEMYDHFLRDFGHGGTRMVYDRGRLEVMTVSPDHENAKKAAARILEIWAYEKDWPLNGFGNVTLRRRDLLIGLEPDECYYIETPTPSGGSELDLNVFPPPDMAIEVEITKSSIGKVSIYAQIGVREIWRWTGEKFIVLQRQSTGEYIEHGRSELLPELPIETLSELTRLALATDQVTALRALRERLRGK